MARSRIVLAAAAALSLPLAMVIPMTSATAATMTTTTAAAAPAGTGAASDIREMNRKDLAFKDGEVAPSGARVTARAQAAAVPSPAVGTVRGWIGLDDFQGFYYRKDYTLRAVGEHVEVWVANDIAFPAGDCRPASSTVVTDQQAQDLVVQFDTNIYPKETATFSTPPDRDGTHARISGDFTGPGEKTVTLVDNVRDDNFYDFPAASTYIAGFFSSQVNNFVDRNVMTIDAFDWLHRTGANPPNDPTNDVCTSRTSRPRLYEGTFAHEWQHLLHSYTDPFETTWMNEGLSDFAQTLVGYVDAKKTIDEIGNDSHINCFQGWGTVATPANPNPRDCGGPQNSLNIWGESVPAAILADYGNAYQLMLFLFDRYGTDFMSRLHQDGEFQGLPSLAHELAGVGQNDLYKVLHDFQSMTLLDRIVGDGFGIVLGVPKNRVTSPSLRSTVNLANPQANNTPGAAPNGADYVSLQKADGTLLRGIDLRSLKFKAATTLPPIPLAWTVVTDDPDADGAALFSGNVNNTDASMVFPATVSAGSPTLTFDAKYGAEEGFDYGYVGVSTDGGATYTIIPGDATVDAPLGPGLNGTTTGFEPRSYDLSAYAGQNVLISIRYVSDGGVNEGGLLVDNIAVGGTSISDGSSLAPFKSPTEIRPVSVDNVNLRLVGIDPAHHLAWQFEFDGKFDLSLNRIQLALLALFPQVVAIVAYDEPTEQVQQYAPYQLTVNGVLQPGGVPAL
jgi:Immune inhibitor A-like, MAM domain